MPTLNRLGYVLECPLRGTDNSREAIFHSTNFGKLKYSPNPKIIVQLASDVEPVEYDSRKDILAKEAGGRLNLIKAAFEKRQPIGIIGYDVWDYVANLQNQRIANQANNGERNRRRP